MSAILHADPAALQFSRSRSRGGHRQCIAPFGESSSSAAWKRSRTGASTGCSTSNSSFRRLRAPWWQPASAARDDGLPSSVRRLMVIGAALGLRLRAAPGTAAAALDESRAIDIAERPRNVADVFAGRHAGGVFLERRARGQLRHLREDGRLVGCPTTDDRSRGRHDSRLVARWEARSRFFATTPAVGRMCTSVRPTGGGERKLSDFRIAGGPSARIAWSPDQRWIVGRPDLAEDLARNGSWALYLIPLGSGTPRRLTDAKAPDIDLAPAFSPDGRRLAYVACMNFSGRNCDVSVLELGADYTPAGPPRPPRNSRPAESVDRLESRWRVGRLRHECARTLGALARLGRWRRRAGATRDARRSLAAAGDRACRRSPGVRARVAGAQHLQAASQRRARARARVLGLGLQSSVLSGRTPHRLQFRALRRRGRDLAGVGRRFRRAATDARPWDASDPAGMVARRTPHCLRIDRRQRPRTDIWVIPADGGVPARSRRILAKKMRRCGLAMGSASTFFRTATAPDSGVAATPGRSLPRVGRPRA